MLGGVAGERGFAPPLPIRAVQAEARAAAETKELPEAEGGFNQAMHHGKDSRVRDARMDGAIMTLNEQHASMRQRGAKEVNGDGAIHEATAQSR